jgi:hemerythrin-like domain-containing protein
VDYKLDMSTMLAIHSALRRDLERLGRIAARPDNPARLLQAAAGWEQFKTFLVAHHTAEDQALWPALREAVAANPDQVALADALEEEHSVIEPLLAAIDVAAADPDDGHRRFGDIIDELISKLSGHLTHEETEGFALIDASLTPEQWQHFAAVNADLVRPEAPNYMPWLLSEADQRTMGAVVGKFPPQMLTVFREQWAPAYAARDLWKGL